MGLDKVLVENHKTKLPAKTIFFRNEQLIVTYKINFTTS